MDLVEPMAVWERMESRLDEAIMLLEQEEEEELQAEGKPVNHIVWIAIRRGPMALMLWLKQCQSSMGEDSSLFLKVDDEFSNEDRHKARTFNRLVLRRNTVRIHEMLVDSLENTHWSCDKHRFSPYTLRRVVWCCLMIQWRCTHTVLHEGCTDLRGLTPALWWEILSYLGPCAPWVHCCLDFQGQMGCATPLLVLLRIYGSNTPKIFVNDLIALGADVNQRDHFGQTSLYKCVDAVSKTSEKSRSIIRMLIDAGVDLGVRDIEDSTALMRNKHQRAFILEAFGAEPWDKIEQFLLKYHLDPSQVLVGVMDLAGFISGSKKRIDKLQAGYQVMDLDATEKTILYYWDERDGIAFQGWWVCYSIGSQDYVAFLPGDVTSPELSSVPWVCTIWSKAKILGCRLLDEAGDRIQMDLKGQDPHIYEYQGELHHNRKVFVRVNLSIPLAANHVEHFSSKFEATTPTTNSVAVTTTSSNNSSTWRKSMCQRSTCLNLSRCRLLTSAVLMPLLDRGASGSPGWTSQERDFVRYLFNADIPAGSEDTVHSAISKALSERGGAFMASYSTLITERLALSALPYAGDTHLDQSQLLPESIMSAGEDPSSAFRELGRCGISAVEISKFLTPFGWNKRQLLQPAIESLWRICEARRVSEFLTDLLRATGFPGTCSGKTIPKNYLLPCFTSSVTIEESRDILSHIPGYWCHVQMTLPTEDIDMDCTAMVVRETFERLVAIHNDPFIPLSLLRSSNCSSIASAPSVPGVVDLVCEVPSPLIPDSRKAHAQLSIHLSHLQAHKDDLELLHELFTTYASYGRLKWT